MEKTFDAVRNFFRNFDWGRAALAAVTLAAAATADFLLQAKQHSWNTFWTLNASAAKWGVFDFIPHDSWHLVQFARNRFLILGVALAAAAWRTKIRNVATGKTSAMDAPFWKVWVAAEVLYLVGRFTFTLLTWYVAGR